LSFESRNVSKAVVTYLRALSAMARANEFSIGPVLMALLSGKLAKSARERKSTERNRQPIYPDRRLFLRSQSSARTQSREEFDGGASFIRFGPSPCPGILLDLDGVVHVRGKALPSSRDMKLAPTRGRIQTSSRAAAPSRASASL
jgi:hypothetical protein